MKHRDDAQPALRFGEQVLARRPGMHLHKAQSQFGFGSWVGRDSHTDEHVVLSIGGMFRSRAVKRLTEDKAWNADLMKTILWQPWFTSDVRPGRCKQTIQGTNSPGVPGLGPQLCPHHPRNGQGQGGSGRGRLLQDSERRQLT